MNDLNKTSGTSPTAKPALSDPTRWSDEEIAEAAEEAKINAENLFRRAEWEQAGAANLRDGRDGPATAETAYYAARMGRRWYEQIDRRQIERERIKATGGVK
jgi:hypothetical protein